MDAIQNLVESYEQDGFVLIPEAFSEQEIACLKQRLPFFAAEESPRRVVEKDGVSVRSVYGPHLTDALFQRLTRDKRLLDPVMRIIGGDTYVYQTKINFKKGFGGDVWQWHQDYIFWLKEDGVPKPQLITAAVYLDEVTEFNGPLYLIPGSHKENVIDVDADETALGSYRESPSWISNLTADLKYSISKEGVARLIRRRGVAAPRGAAGSVLLFHPNVVHASASNILPFDRVLVLITYNRVDNKPQGTQQQRPDFLCGREFSALRPDLFTPLAAD
ncbi:MAG TPA: phytanoyl-CoA dioxygenase family protein [Steroidobacteraceae bacterium]|nr:phytanoyl-CoA dioxygenase family protein [Steroidobacteraceae bacterium]